jgi:hypothetical protein
MDEPKKTEAATEPAYSYKPSLAGAPWQFRLTPDHLAWTKGYRAGSLPYRDIARIRLSFRPMTMQTRRYVTEIWAPGTPKLTIVSTSWKGLMEQTALAGPYSEFVGGLHRRVAASGVRPRCDCGIHPILYGLGLLVYAAVLLGLAVLIVRALQVASYPAALFVAVFFGLFAWQLGHFFKLNKPAHYEPEAPPSELLPRE